MAPATARMFREPATDGIYGISPRANSPFPSSASSPSLRSKESVIVRPLTPTMGAGGGNVKVVVRVRGFLPREIERQAQCLIEMNPDTQSTKLLVPPTTDPANNRTQSRKIIEEKTFTFDNSFWSHQTEDDHYAHQEDIYNALGEEYLDHNFEGYHTCIFAYGQTGSGKSYTMMGTPETPGLIPRTCEDLFQRIESNKSANVSYSVRVSYFEVYNEHVRDLFLPRTNPPHYLKVRENPAEGAYVENLTEMQVKNYQEILKYMRMGDRNRTTASTKMNDTSSRSHSVFTIILKQIHHDYHTDETTERMARIRLVDLAGSERAKATEATGTRLREGSSINRSLTTLGRVIAALASDERRTSPRKQRDVVPYRDSVLTWLLKDSLGGNSKTAMIACIAPSDYDETLSTLRYADQAKRIRLKATVNQDHVSSAEKDAQITELKDTIRDLQLAMAQQQQASSRPSTPSAPSSAISEALEKQAERHNERLREFTAKYEDMLRMTEEKLAISESRVAQLREEKEVVQRHLGLVVGELKERRANETPRGFGTPETKKEKEPTVEVHVDEGFESDDGSHLKRDLSEADEDPDEVEDDDSEYYEDDEYAQEHRERQAREVQEQMQALMSDLGLFRKRVRGDRGQWGGGGGIAEGVVAG
ncbi:MAG: hypothetical protein Q9227_005534 [Pyrenula ochraceoflavens]